MKIILENSLTDPIMVETQISSSNNVVNSSDNVILSDTSSDKQQYPVVDMEDYDEDNDFAAPPGYSKPHNGQNDYAYGGGNDSYDD